MNKLSRSAIAATMREMIAENIANTGLHIQGVMDNPTFYYSIGLYEHFGFEIFNMGLPHKVAFQVFNDIHTSLRDGFKIELDKIYTPENSTWVNLPVKFIKADHPLLFDKWMVQAREWWNAEFPVYQFVLSDRNGLLPGQEGFDHEYMDPRQKLLVAKR